MALNWSKAFKSIRYTGLVLYGFAAALAYLPIFDSPFYTIYELSNFARFTGVSISLADIVFTTALLLTLPILVLDVDKKNLSRQQIIVLSLLLAPLIVNLLIHQEVATFARVIRIVIYTSLPLLLLVNRRDLQMFSLGYLGLVVPQLIAVIFQRTIGEQMSGLTVNPNLVGSYGLTSLVIWYYSYNKSSNIVRFFPIALASLLVILPASRGALLATFGFITIFVFTSRRKVSKRQVAIISASVIVGILTIATLAGPRLDHLLHLHAFSEPTLVGKINIFTSGRISSTKRHINKTSEDRKWLLGYGVGRYTESTGKVPPHNLYLATIIELGYILGVIQLIGFLYLTILRPKLILPLAILGLVSYLTHTAEGTLITYTLLGVAIASLTSTTESSSPITRHIYRQASPFNSQKPTS